MHRQTDYRGQIPYETDFLYAQRFAYEALGLFIMDMLGSSVLVAGLACAPTSPASLAVKVGPGRIYSLQNLDNSAWGVAGGVGGLPADTNADHQIIKQGLFRDTTTYPMAAPGTTGQSINYLVQAAFSETDTGSTVLPFFNASNPAVPWAGPGNSAGALPVTREDKCLVTVKAGTAATTGTQTTPAPDAGNTGLYVVTIAFGQTTVTSGNITTVNGAPFISETLTAKISQTFADNRYLQITNARARLTANTTYFISTTGNDTTGNGTSGAPWATIQKAYNFLQQNIDMNGFTVTIQLADGSYSAGLTNRALLVGQASVSSLVVNGNSTTPANVIVTNAGGSAMQAINGGMFTVQNMRLIGNNGVLVQNFGFVVVGVGVDFGACAIAHMSASTGSITAFSNYTISGSSPSHYLSAFNGVIAVGGNTVTLTGTPAFSTAFANAFPAGIINVAQAGVTYSGSATGSRYQSVDNSVINTNGGGANVFPGNSAGSTSNGGIYV